MLAHINYLQKVHSPQTQYLDREVEGLHTKRRKLKTQKMEHSKVTLAEHTGNQRELREHRSCAGSAGGIRD